MTSRRIIKQPDSYRTFDWNAGAPREMPSGAARMAAPVQARQHDDEQLRQAVQRAYLEGEAAARAALEEPAKAASAELMRAVAGLAEMRAAMYKDAQADLLRLSVAIARRIVHRELLVSPDILESIVSVALEKLDRQEVHRVRVHPAMAVRLDHDLKNLPHQRAIEVAPDATLNPGACIFETGRGNVDAGIDSQLAEIERGLADRLGA